MPNSGLLGAAYFNLLGLFLALSLLKEASNHYSTWEYLWLGGAWELEEVERWLPKVPWVCFHAQDLGVRDEFHNPRRLIMYIKENTGRVRS